MGGGAAAAIEDSFETGTTRLQRLARWAERRRALLLLVGIAVYAAGYTPHWRIDPDGGDYLLIARSIAEGRGFAHPLGLHLSVPPGFPYLLAGVVRAFGTELIDTGATAHLQAMWAINAVLLLIGLGNLALAYWLFCLHGGRLTAVAATVLLGLAETYYSHVLVPLADLPFVTGLLLLLVGLERLYRKRPRPAASVAIALLGVVVMLLMRNVALTALAAAALGLGWELLRRRRFGVLAAALAGMAATLVLLRTIDPGIRGAGGLSADEEILLRLLTDELPETLHRAATQNAHLLFCETASRAGFGADFGPRVNLPFSVLMLALGVGLARRRPVWGMLFVAFSAQWLLFFVTRRYFLPLLPLLALAWWRAVMWMYVRWPWWLPRLAAFALLSLWIGFNGGRVVRVILQQHRHDFIERYMQGRYAGLDQVARAAGALPDDAVIVCEPQYASILMLWTRRRAAGPGALPADQTGALHVLEPLPPDLEGLLADRGWTPGRILIEAGRPGDLPPFVLREVMPHTPGMPPM
jgi:hypothetical protein